MGKKTLRLLLHAKLVRLLTIVLMWHTAPLRLLTSPPSAMKEQLFHPPPCPPPPPPPSPPVNGSDFLAQIGSRAQLEWTGDSTIACVTIPIIDDGRVENDEIFYVNMVRIAASPLGTVPTLAPQTIVMIMDDDCKSVCVGTLISPRHACAARVTVLGLWALVCLSVCLPSFLKLCAASNTMISRLWQLF